jgi:hypothetical protein
MYRKAERIASAFVLLTNHLPESDTLKLESRKTCVEMLSDVLLARSEMRSSNSAGVLRLKLTVRKLISMIRLLAVAGSISVQNAEIVTEAMDELLAFLLASRRSDLSDSVSFSREDLTDMRDSLRFAEDRRTERAPKASVERSETIESGDSLAGRESPAISSRAQAILDVLRERGDSGIRDVSSNLPEYSEKMIQRELAELVSLGKVRKTGHKRWSRYVYI